MFLKHYIRKAHISGSPNSSGFYNFCELYTIAKKFLNMIFTSRDQIFYIKEAIKHLRLTFSLN